MRQHSELFQLSLASHRLTILRSHGYAAAFQGALDGEVCVSAPTREAVLQALLRRVAYTRKVASL